MESERKAIGPEELRRRLKKKAEFQPEVVIEGTRNWEQKQDINQHLKEAGNTGNKGTPPKDKTIERLLKEMRSEARKAPSKSQPSMLERVKAFFQPMVNAVQKMFSKTNDVENVPTFKAASPTVVQEKPSNEVKNANVHTEPACNVHTEPACKEGIGPTVEQLENQSSTRTMKPGQNGTGG